jgi:phosphoenolpyruvate-protein kinase (PTS system EI component)
MEDQVRLAGVGASEGVAVGPVFVHAPGEIKPEREKISMDALEEELGRFHSAVKTVTHKLSQTANPGYGKAAARARQPSSRRTSRWPRTPTSSTQRSQSG